ncbi:PREDICTED: sodium-dependent neutral amino acid transporter B(0)AT3 isoform X6 [Chinchilla lanigera]|uniref:sodium-dependent neutral amino acid transporter B(0)AT3 isoform X6 n=1 Tax=Chinchilla lanigera TaxID=34839 RepID=UPI0006981AE5|nr:PREDICTED: sodium-dependent neutral amino acid transporter B(0)AT3 isoform X6 [Chinchilla lanigera]
MAQALRPDLLVDDGEDGRPRWDNKFQYLLSCVGFAVGLGNIWRFPYLCQTYGGGAFLIPYLIALVFEGIPLFHIELAIGQRLRRGSIGVWTAISPYLGGVGLGCFTVSFLVSLYYNTVLVWVLWYFLNSFQQPLPWAACPPNLNRTGDLLHGLVPIPGPDHLPRQRPDPAWGDRGPDLPVHPQCADSPEPPGVAGRGHTDLLLSVPGLWRTHRFRKLQPAQHPRWPVLVSRNNCRRDAVIIALVNSMTSLYASITIFAIMGFKATSDHGQCLDRNILSLINEFSLPEQSISRDSYPAALLHLNATQPGRVAQLPLRACRLEDFLDQKLGEENEPLSLRAGLVPTARPRVLQGASGPGLAFIVFTEAVLHMPGAPVWAVLFFGMLFTLGLSSMFGNMEGIITPLLDMGVLPRWVPKEVLTGLTCLVCFLSATCFTLQSGSYWLEVFDNFAASLNLVTFAFLEVVGVIYVYGMKRFCADVEWMTGQWPNIYWRMSWRAVSPLLLLGILLSYIALLVHRSPSYKAWNPQYELFPLQEEKLYPGWVQATCMLLSFLPLLWVPASALAQLLARRRQEDTQLDTGLKPQDSGGC